VRQIKRLLKAYRKEGAVGLIAKHGGRKGNNFLKAEEKKKALDLLKSKYKGFGPTLAHERLVEKEKLKPSDESMRQLMVGEGCGSRARSKKRWSTNCGSDAPAWGISADRWLAA
jgi:hypothetical protein